jgi:phosphatidylserine/phosphatidylglycerophosphate/cardiolipin synthase-like enzyme
MGRITTARAWANNEVAQVAWDVDGKIDGCLGFDVMRVYLNDDGTVERLADGSENRVRCATWLPFKGQSNPNWIPQDTGIWPIQKLSWRDLTLRKQRDALVLRPSEVFVRYEVRPLGDLRAGLEPVLSAGRDVAEVPKLGDDGKPLKNPDGSTIMVTVKAFEGDPRPLGYLDVATSTDPIRITSRRGPFRSTFTNGILAAQWLRRVLIEDGAIEEKELLRIISTPGNKHRAYLTGDVVPLITELLARPGQFFLALYELDDQELVDLLAANHERIHLILANTASEEQKVPHPAPGEKKTVTVWDERNKAARQRLVDLGTDIQHRMFNNTIHIGHNKFVVHVPDDGSPRSVLTGSTNWTSTGVAGQTNNALLIEDDAVAGAFLDYWSRLKADVLTLPDPLGITMSKNQQAKALRTSDETPATLTLANGAGLQVWFSPNRPERQKPTSKTHPAPTPPDLQEVYRRMRMAKEVILFLAFLPGQSGNDCIIGEAVRIATLDPSLLITGAVSSPQAMPNYVPTIRDNVTKKVIQQGRAPSTFDRGNISIVRAAAIDDRTALGDFGVEELTANNGFGAIIHDKIMVIDPRLPECSVVLGSHNLGFKASYSNDENMVIVSGDRELAAAYAVHILDVYDHYRFRAVEAALKAQGKTGWSGFLDITDTWQTPYVNGRKGALMRYFAR